MSVERVPLYSGPDHAFAARLIEALRAGGLDPSLEPIEAGTQVMLAPDQIARGAMVLAALTPGSTREAAAHRRRIWLPLLFIPVSLVSMAGGIWGSAETPLAGIATLVLPLCAWYATRKLDAPNANRFGTYGLAMGWERNRVPVPSVDARISPFEIRAPFAFRSVTTFAIPPGHQLVPLRSAQSSPLPTPLNVSPRPRADTHGGS